MGKKSDARAEKRALAQQRFEEGKRALIAKVSDDRVPRQVIEPPEDKSPRVAPHIARAAAKAEAEKIPKAAGGSRYDSPVTWCTTKADTVGNWSWGELRAWTPEEWDQVIAPPFNHFTQLTWRDIDLLSSETGHKMHHGHEVGDLIKEVQERWKALDLEEYDSVFRFRLGGTRRAWGYIVQAHFRMVWWERKHTFYLV